LPFAGWPWCKHPPPRRSPFSLGSARRCPSEVAVTVVIATRDRRQSLLETLARLSALPERPPVVVVDNASSDGTAAAVKDRFPAIDLVGLTENRAAAARTAGVERARTDLVALSDDDSWWAPGSLSMAERVFERNPRLGLAAARILVGEEAHEDPTCRLMAESPLASGGLPGPRVLGFVACGAVVRKDAYLEAGGFDERLELVCEEHLLAIQLARRGWDLAYVPGLEAHHHPSPVRDAARRRRLETRNLIWLTWLLRPAPRAARETFRLTRDALGDPARRRGLIEALRDGRWVMGERRPLAESLEQKLRQLDAQKIGFGERTLPRGPARRGL
jgi:GT2 family glycosyltransferase